MTLVVDASVALRWYVEAPGTEAAVDLLDGTEPLLAPDLVVAEVGNATWKLVRAGKISDEHGRRILQAVPGAFSSLVSSAEISQSAFNLALALDHPLYDCLYLALAEAEGTRVVTADGKLLRKLADSGQEKRALALG